MKYTKEFILTVATSHATEIAKREGITVAQARAQFWKDNPEFTAAYRAAPSTPATTEAPKLSGTLAKATKLAEDLRRAEPTKYRTTEAARAEIWKRNPDLAAQCRAGI